MGPPSTPPTEQNANNACRFDSLDEKPQTPDVPTPSSAKSDSQPHDIPMSHQATQARDGARKDGVTEVLPMYNEDPFKVTWDGDRDPLSPHNMRTFHKWTIVMLVSMGAICVTCASSIYTTTYPQIQEEFNASRTICALGLSSFVLGIAFGPLLTAPLSEYYGRRPIYLISLSLFIIWTIPSIAATNIETLITTRFFQGLTGSSFLSVGGGTVGDMFQQNELQSPMAVVSISTFIGSSIGPLVGGFINHHLHWPWTYCVIIMWAFVLLVGIVFCAPETFHAIRLRDKARRLREETSDPRHWATMERGMASKGQAVALSLLRPFQLIVLEPMALCLHLYAALLQGILYLFFGTLPEIFRVNHGMNLWQSGLAFLGIVIGMVVAACSNPFWVRLRRRLLESRERKTGEVGVSEPEYQLPPAVLGGILSPIGLFWFGWTIQPSVHWLVPIVGSSLFGCGVILVFQGIFTFLVEAYTKYSASALGANGFSRAFLTIVFPLIQTPMVDGLGYNWAVSVLAFLTCVMMPFPWLFFKYGRLLRGKSKFATD